MRVQVGSRLGGPELGQRVRPIMVAVRRELTREFSGIASEDVASVDYTLFFNGTVSEYFPTPGVHRARYGRARKLVQVDLGFDAAETDGRSRAEVATLLRDRFCESLVAIANSVGEHGVAFDLDAARRAVLNALAAVEADG